MKKITKDRKACFGVWMTSSVTPGGWWDTAYVYDPLTEKVIEFK